MHDLKEFLADVFNNPSEYLPMFVSLGVLLAIWSILLITAVCSLRRKSSAWRLVLALAALLPALLLFIAGIPMSIEKNQSTWTMDLSWFFLMPLILGAVGLWTWWTAHRSAAPNGGPATQLGNSVVTGGPPSVNR